MEALGVFVGVDDKICGGFCLSFSTALTKLCRRFPFQK